MGRRLRMLWRLRDPERAPDVVVAPVRALVQRLGPHVEDVEPIVVAPRRAASTATSWSAALVGRRLPARGPGRAPGRGRRARLDRRRVPVDRRRAGAHRPVGRRGRPPHRVLRRPTSARPTTSTRSRSSRAASCCPPTRCASRAERLVGLEPWGREQWERLAEGLVVRRHGVVAAVADRRRARARSTCCGADAQVLLVEPRRMRDRAADLLAEEADLAAHAGRRRGAPPTTRRARLPAPAPRLRPAARPTPRRRRWHAASTCPRAPTRRRSQAAGVGPGRSATATGLVAQLRDAAARRLPRRRRRRRRGLGRAALPRPAARPRASSRRGRRRRPLERGCMLPRRQAGACSPRPTSPAAAAPTARARPRRRDAERLLRRPQGRRLRRAPPARRGPLRRHGQAGHRRRRARLPAARVPGRRQALRPVRPDRRRPPLHRRREPQPAPRWAATTGSEDQGQGAGRGAPRSPRSWSSSTRSGCNSRGHAFAPDTPWQRELEDAFPYEETPDQAQGHRRREGRHGGRAARWTAWSAATSASARPRWPSGPRSRRCRTASRWRCSCPPRCWPSSTSRPSATASPATRCGSRCCRRFLTPGQAKQGGRRASTSGEVDVVIGTHRLLSDDVTFKDLGLLVVDEEQRFGVTHKEADQAAADRRRRAHAHGHAHPPHAGDEPHRHPRPHAAQHAAGRAPADPHLRRRVRRPGRRRGHPPRAAARGPGLLRAQPGAGHRARGRPSSASSCPRPASPSPTGRWTRARLEQVVLDFWEGEYDVLVCTTIIESGIDMPTVNTLVVDRADLLGPRPAPPAPGPGRAGRASGPTPTCSTRRDRALTEEAYERLKTIGEATELGSGFKIAMRDLEIRGAGNLLGDRPVGPHRRGRLRPLLPDGQRGRGRAEGRGGAASRPRSSSTCRSTPTCPTDYVAKEELRLEAYRRLAAVTTEAEVDDIRAEWVDRYGPVPDAGRGAARGRPPAGRVRPPRRPRGQRRQGHGHRRRGCGPPASSPVKLKVSEEIRLKRLVPKGLYKADLGQLVGARPRAAASVAADLVDLLSTPVPGQGGRVAASALSDVTVDVAAVRSDRTGRARRRGWFVARRRQSLRSCPPCRHRRLASPARPPSRSPVSLPPACGSTVGRRRRSTTSRSRSPTSRTSSTRRVRATRRSAPPCSAQVGQEQLRRRGRRRSASFTQARTCRGAWRSCRSSSWWSPTASSRPRTVEARPTSDVAERRGRAARRASAPGGASTPCPTAHRRRPVRRGASPSFDKLQDRARQPTFERRAHGGARSEAADIRGQLALRHRGTPTTLTVDPPAGPRPAPARQQRQHRPPPPTARTSPAG